MSTYDPLEPGELVWFCPLVSPDIEPYQVLILERYEFSEYSFSYRVLRGEKVFTTTNSRLSRLCRVKRKSV